MLVNRLYNQGVITKPMFSLFFSRDDDNQSLIWFGGYDHSFIRKFDGLNNLEDD